MSQPRSAALAARRERLRSLLRHGARFLSPDAELLGEAEKLANLGLVDLQRSWTVRCSHPRDDDFPPPREHCDGLIGLRPDADEGEGHYRCPRCERIVYPEADRKETFDTLAIRHRRAGIEAFLVAACGNLASGRSFIGGVLTLPLEGINGFVCILDYCTDKRWYRRTTAASQPCIYVTVGPDKTSQIIDDDAIARLELADILLGTSDLPGLLTDRAARGPTFLTNVDVAICALGARPIAPEPRERAESRRIFHLCLSPEGLLVDGSLAIRVQRRATAMAIVQVLMKTYAEAAASGRAVEPMTADALADAVEPFIGTVEDAGNIARHIPRLRKSISDTVRRTGEPIDEHDVIETVSRSGADEDAEGYRLNPRSVALGPLQP